MRRLTISLICGLLFGAGLALSDMVNPDRVIGFLDLFGAWDPTLAFVMGGALIPMALAWIVQRSLAEPMAGGEFDLPTNQALDGKLIAGAVIFGIGWGLVGFCPGPAIAVLPLDGWQAGTFAIAMVAGMTVHRLYAARAGTA